MQTLLLLLKFLPLVLEIIQAIQRQKLTAQATQEVIEDLSMTADYLVARANAASATVDDSDDALLSSENNRNRRSA